MVHHFLVVFLALVLDRLIGDPDWLWRRLPHPVVGFGALISAADRAFNREGDPPARRCRNGWLTIAALLAAALLAGALLESLFLQIGIAGTLLEVVVVAIFLAQKSLADHVGRVVDALRREGLAGARRAVALIVGRDPQTLDAAGICRASVESLAENFSDGVVAPVFWFAVLGLPGLVAYKMLNTADSMIAHRTPCHAAFGYGTAKLDDAANWPAARLAAVFIAAAAWWRIGAKAGRAALECVRTDAGLHRSPNAGWPEAAMAGALSLSLAGPRFYHGVAVREPMINAPGRQACTGDDVSAAIRLFWSASTLLAAATLLAVVALA